MPILVALVVLVSVLAGAGYAAFARFLSHRERMAAIEAQRPRVMLALPPGDDRNADQLTDAILEACKQKGIEVELDVT